MPRNSNDRGVKFLHNIGLKRRKIIEFISLFLGAGIAAAVGAIVGTLVLPGVGTGVGAVLGFGIGTYSSILGVSFGRYFKPTGSGSRVPAILGISVSSWCLGIVAGAAIGSVFPGLGTLVGAFAGGLITLGACLAVVAFDQIRNKYFLGSRSAMAPQGSSLETAPDASTHENDHQLALRTDSPSYSQSLSALSNGGKNETSPEPDTSRDLDVDPCTYGEWPLMTTMNGKEVQIGTVGGHDPDYFLEDTSVSPT